MGNHRQRKSKAEKLEIIQYSEKYSVLQASREYGVSSTIIYRWKEAYDTKGESGLEGKSGNVDLNQELKRMKRENDQLKQIVAEKELKLRIQADMLKKSR